MKLPLLFLLMLTGLCFSAPLLETALGLSGTDSLLEARFLAPSTAHWLGTDELGRDLLVRLLQGGQVSLCVGFAAALTTCILGTAIGVTAGYLGGKWDDILMRLTDMMLSLPALPLLILLAAIDPAKLGISAGLANSPYLSLIKIILLVTLLGWTGVARLSRARTLGLKGMDYVLAARALGASHYSVILRHILPNLSSTIAVAAALSVGNVILTESALSFLGLGIQPPLPSWGNMLNNAQETIWEHPGLSFYPGILILVTVLAANALGDGLQKHKVLKQN